MYKCCPIQLSFHSKLTFIRSAVLFHGHYILRQSSQISVPFDKREFNIPSVSVLSFDVQSVSNMSTSSVCLSSSLSLFFLYPQQPAVFPSDPLSLSTHLIMFSLPLYSITNVETSITWPCSCSKVKHIDGQGRLVRLQMDNFCLFLRKQTERWQTFVCTMSKG